MIGAGKRHHGVAIRVGRHAAAMLVRRAARGNEMNFVEMKAALGGARHGQVADVNGIERAAKKRDAAFARRFARNAARLAGGATLNGPLSRRGSRALTWRLASTAVAPVQVIRYRALLRFSQARDRFTDLRRSGVSISGSGGARRSSASAMARTSCGMPSPDADEMA